MCVDSLDLIIVVSIILSSIVDGGWLVFRWDWSLLRIICNCLPFSLVFKLSIGIIASLNLRLHKSLAKRSTH
jgi:hypothetical protein